MAKGFKQFTYLIAKDISRKRQIKSLKNENQKPEEIALNNINKYKQLKDKKDLNITLDILSNPFKIIEILKKDGIKGLYKSFIAPVSCIVIHHSFLPRMIKSNIEKGIHKSSKQIVLKGTTNHTEKVQQQFKLVA